MAPHSLCPHDCGDNNSLSFEEKSFSSWLAIALAIPLFTIALVKRHDYSLKILFKHI